jgi:ribosomal protein S18 acetylase RimI-like enzyme
MDHVLDNPIWNGLISGNRHLAEGHGNIRYFPPEITTFAGIQNFSAADFDLLSELCPPGTVKATFTPRKPDLPTTWIIRGEMPIHQMVHNGARFAAIEDLLMQPLDKGHVKSMLALTKLTNPGPFYARTIEFGNYFGYFDGDLLIAMAGQRLQPHTYSEISAVCTHPAYIGKGYARKLLQHQLKLISAAGKTAILHVKVDNLAAIALYESLGFVIRRQLQVLIFQKLD